MIRLTLLLTAGIVGTMLAFGHTDTGAAPEPVTERVLAPLPDPVPGEARDIEARDIEALVIEAAATADATDVARREVVFPTFAAARAVRVDASDAPADHTREAAPVAAADRLVVTGSLVNLRAGPSTETAILGRLARGTETLRVATAAEGWLLIRDPVSGSEGYMSAEFLTAAR